MAAQAKRVIGGCSFYRVRAAKLVVGISCLSSYQQAGYEDAVRGSRACGVP
jgi:hypothetical protein